MRRRDTALILVAALVVAVGAGVYYNQTAQTHLGSSEIRLAAADFFFIGDNGIQNPNLKVNLGDRVTIALQNQGGRVHKLMIVDPEDFQNYVEAWRRGERPSEPSPAFQGASIDDVPPGESKSMTFIANKLDTYIYACFEKEPNLHAHLGMRGYLIVEEAGGLALNGIELSLPSTSICVATMTTLVRSDTSYENQNSRKLGC